MEHLPGYDQWKTTEPPDEEGAHDCYDYAEVLDEENGRQLLRCDQCSNEWVDTCWWAKR